jgi:phosphotriesterase-related protein
MMKTIYIFFIFIVPISILPGKYSCTNKDGKVMAIHGEIRAGAMGKTLTHEHLLVDFIGADSTGYHRWNKDSVVAAILPYLNEIKNMGFKTIVECTPAYLGRDPELLKMLSDQSGIQFITNTGYYGAVGGKYLPQHAWDETAEQLAERWMHEVNNGIEGTGVNPGFIKIAVEDGPLEHIHRKLVSAAALTHISTGLVIMSHTGPSIPAFQQLEILKNHGVHPSAFIWTHAQSESDFQRHAEAANRGTWVAFDGFSSKELDRYVEFIVFMKKRGLLDRILISHDAGWYRPGEPGGGAFRGFTDIEELLVPALREIGVSQQDIYQLFVLNPKEALKIKARLM